MNANELKDKKIEELETILLEEQRRLFTLKNELSESKKLEKPHLISATKKLIARIHTIISQKQAQEQAS